MELLEKDNEHNCNGRDHIIVVPNGGKVGETFIAELLHLIPEEVDGEVEKEGHEYPLGCNHLSTSISY